MTKICFCISLCFLYASTVFAQVGSEASLAPLIGTNFYDDNFVYQNSTSYGLALSASLIGSLSTGISYKTSQTSAVFELPGNNLSINIRWHLYQIHFTYELITVLKIIHFSPGLGLGTIHFTKPELMIDLGAFGNKEISSKSSSHFAYSAAVNVRVHISGRFSLLLSPGIMFFETQENKYTNYYVEGGISIAIM